MSNPHGIEGNFYNQWVIIIISFIKASSLLLALSNKKTFLKTPSDIIPMVDRPTHLHMISSSCIKQKITEWMGDTFVETFTKKKSSLKLGLYRSIESIWLHLKYNHSEDIIEKRNYLFNHSMPLKQ